ncbi:M20 family peptidase [Parablautia intestinalis]|uniref:M20 family peptidase n=1 Tax=Parablautia intestinalis TaxID=2320100 RepID=A0A3A9AZ33_9FIRM|nr:M20/M25/M40 family metallo-hydrolase [Parablautia intestinalis]RKI92456.1 M20 family peptidase [Parablautia intestinalis]
MEDLKCWLESQKEQIVKDIEGLVSIESVAEKVKEHSQAPFGDKCREVLDKMLSYGLRDKMAAFDHAGYCGSVLVGEGKEEIGIWSHLDVVPAGKDWLYSPFSMSIKDGCLIGRGVQDNKGPAIAVYYTLKYCQEKKLLKNICVRQIFGCQEESGMGDVIYYLSHNKAPAYSFVADCGFPVCCGEKGICRITMEGQEAVENLLELQGGVVCNSVPDFARAQLLIGEEKIDISARGIGGHAASPEGTVNAIGVLAEKMKEYELPEGLKKAVSFLYNAGSNGYGEKIGIACEDEISGRLTCNAGVLSLEEGKIRLTLDIRYPVTIKVDDFLPKLAEGAGKAGFAVKEYNDSRPYYMEKDHPFVELLMDAWREETGLDGEPYVMGGGTYARHIPNAVAFGTGMDRDLSALNLPEGHGNCHGADETEVLDNLLKSIHIYVNALCKLDSRAIEKQ